jgi:hypothetical protein
MSDMTPHNGNLRPGAQVDLGMIEIIVFAEGR